MITEIPSVQSISEQYGYNPEAPAGASANVIDKYRGYLVEQIRLDLDTQRGSLINVCVNTNSDFNLSSVIRSGNAMGARATIVAGRRKWDRRGSVGTHTYEHVLHTPDTLELIKALINDGYTVIPVDNTPELSPKSIFNVEFPEKTAFLYGEEGPGLDFEVAKACNHPAVYLPQGGSTRSINVACAATTFMYEYSRQHPQPWM